MSVKLIRNLLLFGISILGSFSIASAKNIVIFGDSLSDAGYENNLHNKYSKWPDMPGILVSHLPKQATFTSPKPFNSVWAQYLGRGSL